MILKRKGRGGWDLCVCITIIQVPKSGERLKPPKPPTPPPPPPPPPHPMSIPLHRLATRAHAQFIVGIASGTEVFTDNGYQISQGRILIRE